MIIDNLHHSHITVSYPFDEQYTDGTCVPSRSICLDNSWIIKYHPNQFTIMLSNISIYILQEIFSTVSSCFINHSTYINMNTTDYQPMAREYSVWNAAVLALYFWTADIKTHILTSYINKVFNAFF